MYSCRKCNQTDMFIEIKGNNTGLYCEHCGAWQKWLNKQEIKVFERYIKKKSNKKADLENLFEEDKNPFNLENNSIKSNVMSTSELENTNVNLNQSVFNKSNDCENEPMITLKIPLRLVKEIINCIEE